MLTLLKDSGILWRFRIGSHTIFSRWLDQGASLSGSLSWALFLQFWMSCFFNQRGFLEATWPHGQTTGHRARTPGFWPGPVEEWWGDLGIMVHHLWLLTLPLVNGAHLCVWWLWEYIMWYRKMLGKEWNVHSTTSSVSTTVPVLCQAWESKHEHGIVLALKEFMVAMTASCAVYTLRGCAMDTIGAEGSTYHITESKSRSLPAGDDS